MYRRTGQCVWRLRRRLCADFLCVFAGKPEGSDGASEPFCEPSARVEPVRGADMAKLNIVLFEPEIPANTGNIGRTCVATGTRLHLIEPLGFSLSEKALKRAGMDYWPHLDVTTYIDYRDFMEKIGSEDLYGNYKITESLYGC